MELSLLITAEGIHSVNYIFDVWSSQPQVMTGLLLTASSRFRQGFVVKQTAGQEGSLYNSSGYRALFQSFALPSSYCQGVSVPPRSSSCCPSLSNSPSGSGDTSPASVAEETQHPRGSWLLLSGSAAFAVALHGRRSSSHSVFHLPSFSFYPAQSIY